MRNSNEDVIEKFSKASKKEKLIAIFWLIVIGILIFSGIEVPVG